MHYIAAFAAAPLFSQGPGPDLKTVVWGMVPGVRPHLTNFSLVTYEKITALKMWYNFLNILGETRNFVSLLLFHYLCINVAAIFFNYKINVHVRKTPKNPIVQYQYLNIYVHDSFYSVYVRFSFCTHKFAFVYMMQQ